MFPVTPGAPKTSAATASASSMVSTELFSARGIKPEPVLAKSETTFSSTALLGPQTSVDAHPGLGKISCVQFNFIAGLLSGWSVTSAKAVFSLLATLVRAEQLFRFSDSTTSANGGATPTASATENNLAFLLVTVTFLFAAVSCTLMQNLGIFYFGALQSLPSFHGCSILFECSYGLVFWQEYGFYEARNIVGVFAGFCLNFVGIYLLSRIQIPVKSEERSSGFSASSCGDEATNRKNRSRGEEIEDQV
ncbi:unnamed protein product [Amoebophrya sp. A120]|nr:unnamed protein product [Amoebophrya sp. A120]|eukprot:GSA120T00007984001.1